VFQAAECGCQDTRGAVKWFMRTINDQSGKLEQKLSFLIRRRKLQRDSN